MLLALILLVTVGVVGSVVVFLIWTAEQAILASRYKKLMAGQKEQPKSDRWRIYYRMNGVIRYVDVDAKTEEDALRGALLKGVNPRGIEKTERL